jgi:hypothetical protein
MLYFYPLHMKQQPQFYSSNAEQDRLIANQQKPIPLEPWGPYLSERQWGTVREDYGPHGDAWGYLPFDQSHLRAYKWGEDGIGGISDYFQHLCFALAMWNGKDAILKERLFGLGNYEGNHGEDVKELYYYLDNTPTHSYMEYLYKYPQAAFPYQQLREENQRRGKDDPEYEILDTGVFDEGDYFDVQISYAKAHSQDIGIRITITNHSDKPAPITLLPTLWFTNRWWNKPDKSKPRIERTASNCILAKHPRIGDYHFYYTPTAEVLFTENETNREKLAGKAATNPYTKDAFHEAIIRKKNVDLLAKRGIGTKAAPVYHLHLAPGEVKHIYLRLTNTPIEYAVDTAAIEGLFQLRKQEADAFYAAVLPRHIATQDRTIQRQALAGLLWSKQFYHYDVERWLQEGDEFNGPQHNKKIGRNHDWTHLKNQDIVLMPDKWEYPWYAAWDLAFHCISLAMVDPVFAKHQLQLIMREWYMKPDGQLPAYEWNFSDVNPPVQAWAALEVYRIEKETTGKADISFLKKVFQKFLINFTWWVNRKDTNGNSVFEGGFLGLDNIGVFNRSHHHMENAHLEQADGTSWMGMYALNMMDMALEIAQHDPSFEDSATKFCEHFVLIAEALNSHVMWNEEDKFYYDTLCFTDADPLPLRIQSIVGLTSLFAVSTIADDLMHKLPDFRKRITWFESYRQKNGKFWPNEEHSSKQETLLSLVPRDKLLHLLNRLLNEQEFLSPGGVRSLSKHHEKNPYHVTINGHAYTISYDPGDSTSNLFGGNSNWRGPVWMPINYLIIRSLRKYGSFYGTDLVVDCPSGSGLKKTLSEVADDLTKRVISLMQRNEQGVRPCYGPYNAFYARPENRDLIQFFEYFHGDDGRGLGASHQTGWTALVADLIGHLRVNDG